MKLTSWINICVYKVHLDAQLDLPSQINLMGRLAVSKILNLTSWPSMCCVFKKKGSTNKRYSRFFVIFLIPIKKKVKKRRNITAPYFLIETGKTPRNR